MPSRSGTSQKYADFPFDSRREKYKTPFGAVGARENTHIVFPVAESLRVERVTLFLRRHDYITPRPMKRTGKKDGYDIFEADFRTEREGTYYYRFEAYRGNEIIYIGKGEGGTAVAGEWLPEWVLNSYETGYETPDFFKGGVVYHIFVDRFAKAGETVYPKFGVLKNWDEDVTVVDPDGVYRANDFYGGNLKGITEKLDYLESLGVTVIYLSPIFESSSNHRYDTGDYMKIDPMVGDEEDFKMLLERAKEKGISIMLDGVFNHTGADSKYFNKFGHYEGMGAYQSTDSPYFDWYTFYEFPDDYHCWWGITVVPTVARNAKGFHELIAGKNGVLKKWTDMGVKGWRLDVVDELSSNFVKELRRRIKFCDENCAVIGEVWEDASLKYSYGEEREYFRGEELDGVMNYVFKEAILGFLMGGNGREFADKVMEIMENYPKQSLDMCMTLIDSHDTVRAINALSGVVVEGDKTKRRDYRLSKEEYELGKKRLMLAAAIQYFLPGVPAVYYGDEIGMQGFEDPINRRPFAQNGVDEEILAHYKMLGNLRKNNRESFVSRAAVHGNGAEITIIREGVALKVNREEMTFRIL